MHPRLLFMPGAGGEAAFWRPLGELLPPEWPKTYLAWPGLGDQPPRRGIDTFDDLVRLVEARLGDAPVDLVAQSMGGAVALRVALDYPHRVRRLVLAATSDGLDVTSLGASDWRPAYRQEYPHAAAWITDVRPNFTPELSRVTNPTLLLWGDADPISPVAVGRRLQSLLPKASLHVVPGADHGLAHDRPREIVEAIRKHLA